MARIHVDHPLALRVEEVVEDEFDVGGLQIDGRLEAQLEIPVAGAAGGKRLQLNQQRGHEVEGDPDLGKLLQERHHAVVILQRVQPDPRQEMLASGQIFVEGLVHVPEDCDFGHRWYSEGGKGWKGGTLPPIQPSVWFESSIATWSGNCSCRWGCPWCC